jgi:hypothetical protein
LFFTDWAFDCWRRCGCTGCCRLLLNLGESEGSSLLIWL